MSLGSLSPPASLDFYLAVPLAHEELGTVSVRVQPTDAKCRGKGCGREQETLWTWSRRLTLPPLIWSSAIPVQGQEKQKETGGVEGRGWELESGPYLSLLLEPCCGKRRWSSASPVSGSPVAQRRGGTDGDHTEEEIPTPQWSLGTAQSGPSRTWVQRWSCGRWTQRVSLEGSPGSGTLYLGPQLWPQEVTVLLLVSPLGP